MNSQPRTHSSSTQEAEKTSTRLTPGRQTARASPEAMAGSKPMPAPRANKAMGISQAWRSELTKKALATQYKPTEKCPTPNHQPTTKALLRFGDASISQISPGKAINSTGSR